MTLWEEAEIFELGGISFYAWGLFCALGMAAMTIKMHSMVASNGRFRTASTSRMGMTKSLSTVNT